MDITAAIRAAWPGMTIVYGGVIPSYHWQGILDPAPHIDIIVRGEGEATVVTLVGPLAVGAPLDQIPSLAVRREGKPFATLPAPMLRDFDSTCTTWELVDLSARSYWSGLRFVVMQIPRGCRHPRTYCGHRDFWNRWRHRAPVVCAREIAWLYREMGMRLVNLADQNSTSSRQAWEAFLYAMIDQDVPVLIIGYTRAVYGSGTSSTRSWKPHAFRPGACSSGSN